MQTENSSGYHYLYHHVQGVTIYITMPHIKVEKSLYIYNNNNLENVI